ncbi:hypothetical protein H5410_030866, partial [Solanum commersonii]
EIQASGGTTGQVLVDFLNLLKHLPLLKFPSLILFIMMILLSGMLTRMDNLVVNLLGILLGKKAM